ncbi:hypothetical protein GCM10011409_37690 [Lentibacillus populi]|uniref:Uncharacterized protein n=1 Tax=Lentibacillus populi TaxID=1827502 RepID=A0A9W5U0M9_9BACI|nr:MULTISPECIES: hypothetical protein [Bacillaceae]MBT2215561.1 hypothetical protein [Virgibacillus dakarensis]GGB56559.1 hypothetical protein GCM10011409_37690 [Lentibacillus populi]
MDIKEKYYKGFEGEPEIEIVNEGEKVLRIWNGYFETLLESLFNEEDPVGLIKEYVFHEGWYDESPWEIKDLDLAIEQFKKSDINNIRHKEEIQNILPILPELSREIVSFLQDSKEKGKKVYIVYE